MLNENLAKLMEMSKDQLEMLQFRPYRIKDGTLIMLVPKMFFPIIPDGTVLTSTEGYQVTVGKSYIDTQSVDGYILYGLVPKEVEKKVSVDVKEIMQYTYFEGIPWYLMRIGATTAKDIRPSAYHFTTIHSSHQGVAERGEYLEEHPLEGLSYLLLFCAVSRIFHGTNKRIFDDVVESLGYSPIEGDWTSGEKFIEDELRHRMTPLDIKRVSLKTHLKEAKV